MATDLNSVMIIGRLTADPQLKYLPNGNAVVEFSIANNYFVPNKDKEVNYFDIVAFGKTAETVAKYLSKGKQIAITGSLRQDRWQDKEGNSKSRIRIIMQSMQMLGGAGGGSPQQSSENFGGHYEAENRDNSAGSVDIGNFSDEDEVPF